MLIPFLNELLQLCVKLIFGFKICNVQAFALENTEPLFHLIHPGAMHGCEVHDKAWMMCQPRSDLFPMVRADMVAHQMNRADLFSDFHIYRFEKGDKFLPQRGMRLPGLNPRSLSPEAISTDDPAGCKGMSNSLSGDATEGADPGGDAPNLINQSFASRLFVSLEASDRCQHQHH